MLIAIIIFTVSLTNYDKIWLPAKGGYVSN